MTILLCIGFLMVGVSVLFCYLELLPFLDAIKSEVSRASNPLRVIMLPAKIVIHLPKLIPSVIDLVVTVFLSGSLGFGGGLLGGITGLFASNIISIIIYYHTHFRRKYV